MSRPTEAIINLAALKANLKRVFACAPQQKVMAVLKADGYGHGAVAIAQALETQVNAFAVCCLEEALALRTVGIHQPIILLEGFFHTQELPLIEQHQLQPVLHHRQQVEALLGYRFQSPLPVWLKVDSGMHRLGLAPEDIEPAYQRLSAHLKTPIHLMSHLACADDPDNPYTHVQTQCVRYLAQQLNMNFSLANSAAILAWPQTLGDWVRPGLMLYGVSPFPQRSVETLGLQAVMQLQSKLISVRICRQGEGIGYGASWHCPQSMPVGIVATGYADGYPRHAPSGTPVLVNGQRVPLIGRISMDMLAVDLRSQPQAKVGDPVILWGPALPVEEIATHAGTLAYELLCHVSPRVKRIYDAD